MAHVQENRWQAKPRAAAALKFAIYVVPFVVAVLAARAAQSAIRQASIELPWLLTALLASLVAAVVLLVSGRILRRLLPLAILLKLSLLFPDQVPSRFGIALRAASPKRLQRQLESADAEQATVAERVLTLVSSLASHDRRTRGHSERVRALTMLLADRMGIVGEERDKLEWASLLHDLGKLDVPAEILNKKGRPSEDEWAVLRQHPAGGPGYAAGLAGWMGPWIHAMDQHHERYDGTGYPNGIVAEDITLSGRIVAVSDAFEVMTATRSYKVPMTAQAARGELVACAGSHFDPAVVRSFMQVTIGDIHKALGPLSWLGSLPFLGPAIGALGSAGSGIVLGGSVAPALAAAAALTLLASPPPTITEQPPPDAIATVDTSDASEADPPEENATPGEAIHSEDGGSESTTDSDPLEVPVLVVPDPDVVVPEVPEVVEPVDEVVEETLAGLTEIVEDLTEVIPGDVADDVLGLVEDTVEPLDPLVDAVGKEAETLVEDTVEPVAAVVDDAVVQAGAAGADVLGGDLLGGETETPELPVNILRGLG